MQTKKLNIVLLLSMVFIAASAFVSYAGMNLEAEAPVGGISIALNHYYARTLEPEKGLAKSIEMVSSGTIVLTEERAQQVQKVTQKLIEEATPEEREIVTENAVTWGTVVGTNNLRLRSGPSSEAKTLTLLGEGDHYVVIGQEGDFLKVQVDDDLEGYVFKDYIDTSIKYDDEKLTPEEEAARKAETARLKKEAEEAMKALEEAKKAEKEKKDDKKKEETTQAIKGTDAPTKGTGEETVAPPTKAGGEAGAAPEGGEELIAPTPDYGTLHEETAPPVSEKATEETTKAPETTKAKETQSSGPGSSGGPGSVTNATRTAMVAYAKQFLGNPYVYGGTDMYNGTDCSGFTMNIYAHFGYNIGRTSRDQAAKGTEISQSEAQPGDLFFYDKDGYINHVTMYIGNGQVIHASSPTNGIIISSANYRTPCKCCRFIK